VIEDHLLVELVRSDMESSVLSRREHLDDAMESPAHGLDLRKVL
jgi:hypothetical protein